jgi:adenylyltransferase/sulfurtransferase
MIANGNVDVIDVREPHEIPAVNEFKHLRIPLAQLAENSSLLKSENVIAFCQSGKRSLQAAKILTGIFGDSKKIYSLHGGIVEWKKQKQTV